MVMKNTINTLKYWLIIIGSGLSFGYLAFAVQDDGGSNPTGAVPLSQNKAPAPKTENSTGKPALALEPAKTEQLNFNSFIKHNLGFISQAPTGNWKDPRQQDGCEEASSWMAVAWARGEKLASGQAAEKKIIDIADWEKKNYGEFHDTSVADTAEMILSGYFKFDDYRIEKNVTAEDLKLELSRGNVIIMPANGKKLNNPNFQNGGPDHHMLVIIGYDPKTKEFISNDPGTRLGAGYRYPEKIIEGAIRDYPTGFHLPVTTVAKNVIVIEKVN